MSAESTALAVRTVADMAIIGEQFEKSGMFGCSQQGQGLVLAMTCLAEGISPIRFGQTYHIIDGRVSMRADAMLAKFMERGGKFIIRERSTTRAAACFIKDGNELEAEYTMDEARASGICLAKDGKSLKTNWAKFPKQMLWARLVSDTVRALDPGVNMGTYTPEEVQDIDDTPTARVVVPEPIKRRAKTAAEAAPAAEPAPAPAVEPEVVASDFGTMPAGIHQGKAWSEFTTAQLKTVLGSNHPAFADGHKDAVRAELANREAAQ